MKNTKASLIIILFLLVTNAVVAMQYLSVRSELQETKELVSDQRRNQQTLDFYQLFVEEVLHAEGEVDFETRLQLENSVRGIGDEVRDLLLLLGRRLEG
jgi:hypothetical protein